MPPSLMWCAYYLHHAKQKKCLQLNMLCNLHLQLSQCTRIANLNTDLAGFCRSRFMLSFSLWLAQRNCQEEIKWHAVWIEMPYATTHTVVLSYLQTMRVCQRQKYCAYNINSLYISSFDFERVFIFFFSHTSNYS